MENDFNRKIKPSRYILFKKIINTTENILYDLCPKLVKQSRKIIDTSESDSCDSNEEKLQNNENNNESQENDQETASNSSDSTENDINEILNSEICLYDDQSDVSDLINDIYNYNL